MTTANKITITRILMIPLFVTMALYYGRSVSQGAPQEWMRWTAVVLFISAAASDGIDGYIARRYNQMSKLGVILDPIADKGLLLAGIITLSMSNWHYEFPVWFPVLVISRDVVIMAGTFALHFILGSVKISPSWLGKTATVTQMIAIGFVMLQWNAWSYKIGGWRMTFLDIPVFIAGFFTLVSGLGYVRLGIRLMHSAGHGDPRPPSQLLR